MQRKKTFLLCWISELETYYSSSVTRTLAVSIIDPKKRTLSLYLFLQFIDSFINSLNKKLKLYYSEALKRVLIGLIVPKNVIKSLYLSYLLTCLYMNDSIWCYLLIPYWPQRCNRAVFEYVILLLVHPTQRKNLHY